VYTDILKLNNLNISLREIIKITYNYFNSNDTAIQDLSDLRKSFSSPADQKLFDIVAEHLLKCEVASPKSSNLFLGLLLGHSYEIDDPAPLKKDFCKDLLKNYFNNDIDVIYDALSLAGLTGKIVLKKGHGHNAVIELAKGFEFDIRPAISIKNSEILHAKLILIDGYIENVSEIHHVLEEAATDKQSLILCARGMHAEVLHTLKVNFDRKTVVCIPFIIPFDVDGANLLVDLAVVSNSDVISFLKGQLISSISLKDYVAIDSVIIENDKICIKNQKSHETVDRHVVSLQRKILSAENDASVEALTKRIKRLGNNQVNIVIPADIDHKKVSFFYDRCIRAFKAASQFGVVRVNGKIYPYPSVKAAEFYEIQFKKLISEIGCIIY
jgi:hypothetical protein